MNKPKMILFDSGGTLCRDTDYDMLRATRAIMPYVTVNPRGLTSEELYGAAEEVYESFRPMRTAGFEQSEWAIMRLACAKNGVGLDLDEDSFERVYRAALTPVEPMPHVGELLDFLNAEGFRTGVISNTKFSGRSLRERLNGLFPQNRFEFFIASCDYATRKPKPALFEIALASACLPASEVWYCGDSPKHDVDGARSVGIFPVLYDPYAAFADAQDCLRVTDWREMIACLKAQI